MVKKSKIVKKSVNVKKLVDNFIHRLIHKGSTCGKLSTGSYPQVENLWKLSHFSALKCTYLGRRDTSARQARTRGSELQSWVAYARG